LSGWGIVRSSSVRFVTRVWAPRFPHSVLLWLPQFRRYFGGL